MSSFSKMKLHKSLAYKAKTTGPRFVVARLKKVTVTYRSTSIVTWEVYSSVEARCYLIESSISARIARWDAAGVKNVDACRVDSTHQANLEFV